MEGNNNQTKKEMTIGDLAQIVTKGFEQVDQRFNKVDKRFDQSDESMDKKIEELATNVQNEFLTLNSSIEAIDENVKNIKTNLNKKVDIFTHKELEIRVERVEEKLQLKPKLKFA